MEPTPVEPIPFDLEKLSTAPQTQVTPVSGATPAPAAAAAPAPAVTPPRAVEMDLGIHVDEAMSGKPQALDKAYASATTRFELDAPVGAEIRVRTPEGVGMNGFAWANKGLVGVGFTKQGAEWVSTADKPLSQISLQTSAFQNHGDAIRVEGGQVNVDDLTPSVLVDGVAQDSTKPTVNVIAPLGWQTAAANGAADVLHEAEGVKDTVAGVRDAGLGAATSARFTGRAPDGHDTVGPIRVLREAKERVGDAAASAAYIALMLTGKVG
jgi:hypothetical protein